MEKYTLALDIGTTSVGWTVINDKLEISTFNEKNLWGVRLFDSASTAEVRRTQRGSRRRYLRRRRRLELLQYLFQMEMNKIDTNFFDITVENDKWLKNKRFIACL
ncbi:MAG: type II CRISPR RNA-guided endonuclease Cas9 [Bacilli bacterium]